MFRFASAAPVCLIVAGCAEIALPDLSVPAAPAVRSFPVQDAACVSTVRQEVRVVDVRIEERTVLAEDAVSYELAVGRDGTRWTCIATAEGATTAVGRLQGPEPGAPLTATVAVPRQAAPAATSSAAAPVAPAPSPAPAPVAPAPSPSAAAVAETPAAPPSGPVILRESADAPSGPAVLPAPDPRSLEPTEPLPAFN